MIPKNKKTTIKLFSAILGLGILKLYSPEIDVQLATNQFSAAECSPEITETKQDYDIFNQTDTDIYMHQPSAENILFSGCDGLF